MDKFTTEVYPFLLKYVRKCFPRDEEKQSIALCYAWYIWRKRREELPLRVFALQAVRAVRQGRDLPGVTTNNHQPDAMDKAWQGAGMGEVKDRQPRPDVVAERREIICRLKALADQAEGIIIDMLLDGYSQNEIARELDINPHTVIAYKRRLRDRL